jgi:hypothetical protein
MIGSPHLTSVHEPELDRCMRQTHRGQAAWAGWHSPPGKTCVACAYFERERRKSLLHELKGRCAKYRALLNEQGSKIPAESIACRFFEAAP